MAEFEERTKGLEVKLPQLTKKSSNLNIGKLGMVIESSKIPVVLQPSTIQFYLHAPLMYFCPFRYKLKSIYVKIPVF
jgi:hypothetical protein